VSGLEPRHSFCIVAEVHAFLEQSEVRGQLWPTFHAFGLSQNRTFWMTSSASPAVRLRFTIVIDAIAAAR
jgi:hypothetical protein